MGANHSKPYLCYLNELVNEQNNTYHILLIKNLFINADYSDLTEKIEANPTAPMFKVTDRVRITKCKNIFSNSYAED